MFDPLSDNTRIVNVPGTDALLQMQSKKGKTRIIALSKEKLRGSPDSWKSSIASGILIYSTLFIWASFFAPAAFPILLLGSPIFILATTIGMKAFNNLLIGEPVQEEATPENARDFVNVETLPEVTIEKDLLYSSENEIIESYRSVINRKREIKENDYINDRSFSALFNSQEEQTEETFELVEEPVIQERKTL